MKFATPISAYQAWARMTRGSNYVKRLAHYTSSVCTLGDLEPSILRRIHESDIQLNPPKVLVASGFDPKAIKLKDYLVPFELEKHFIKGKKLITYHTTQASVTDFLEAFNEGKAGIPNSKVTEIPSKEALLVDVFKIIVDKLANACLDDFKDSLNDTLYKPAIRRAKIKAKIRAPRRLSSTTSGLKFFLSSNPIDFFLSPKPRRNLQKQIKAATESMRMEMNETEVQKSLEESQKEILLEIPQPPLQGKCSRLSPIGIIEEKHKRPYLRPYAESRLSPYEKTRGNKFHMLESQFPVNEEFRQLRNTNQNQEIIGKRIYFEKSIIQGWGLFALEQISPETLICEYTGDLIRSRIADERERIYEKRGYPHMYLFRIDNEYVVDATCRGGYARFYNHSCRPNCRSNVVPSGDTQIISFYAKHLIQPHEELTFNYEMEFETDASKRMKCYCGDTQCLGYLNYCDDEEVRKRRELQALLVQDSDDEMGDLIEEE